MFSVAAVSFKKEIYDDAGVWRVFSQSDSLSARLATRVEFALQTVPAAANEQEAREALLAIAGAGLLSASCDHAPGECDGENGD